MGLDAEVLELGLRGKGRGVEEEGMFEKTEEEGGREEEEEEEGEG